MARQRDDFLIAQIVNADLLETGKAAVLGDGEQILAVGYREETQRADVLQVG